MLAHDPQDRGRRRVAFFSPAAAVRNQRVHDDDAVVRARRDERARRVHRHVLHASPRVRARSMRRLPARAVHDEDEPGAEPERELPVRRESRARRVVCGLQRGRHRRAHSRVAQHRLVVRVRLGVRRGRVGVGARRGGRVRVGGGPARRVRSRRLRCAGVDRVGARRRRIVVLLVRRGGIRCVERVERALGGGALRGVPRVLRVGRRHPDGGVRAVDPASAPRRGPRPAM
eukprot:29272-Pelagococcus_subviridis.AAC.1